MRFALVDGGSVLLVVESGDVPTTPGTWVECAATVGPGDLYDGTEFSKPAPVALPRHITQLAFLQRFSQAERLAIRTAAKTSVAIEDYMAMVTAARFIDLDRADTRAGVQAMEAATLLASGRALQILDAAVQDSERV